MNAKRPRSAKNAKARNLGAALQAPPRGYSVVPKVSGLGVLGRSWLVLALDPDPVPVPVPVALRRLVRRELRQHELREALERVEHAVAGLRDRFELGRLVRV